MQADFRQTVLNRSGQIVQQVTGSMQLSRPGKFRWEYETPYVQLIVGDGHKIWLFDPDLNQVTVRTLGTVLGSNPAALLAGSDEIENSFEIEGVGQQSSLEWIKATPLQQDGSFDHVLLGFRDDQLAEMELHDNFGQITVIEFLNVKQNPKLDMKSFSFIPPPGVDIVGE